MLPQPSTSPGPPKVIHYNVSTGLGLHNVTDQSLAHSGKYVGLQSANEGKKEGIVVFGPAAHIALILS